MQEDAVPCLLAAFVFSTILNELPMLGTRLVIGFSMVGGLLAVLCLDEFLAPWFPFWFLLAIFALGSASLELVSLFNETSARPSGNTVFGGVMARGDRELGAAPGRSTDREDPQLLERLPYDPLLPVSALAWPLLTFVFIVMAAFVVQSVQFQKPGATMATIAGTVLAVSYVGLLGSFIIQLRWFDGPYHGILPLAFLVATSKGADTGAYTVGRIFGPPQTLASPEPEQDDRRRPGRTGRRRWRGIDRRRRRPFRAAGPHARLGALRPASAWWSARAAQLGDLMESMIKPRLRRKDASDSVPGFGGVLDVLDSLLFAGPVAFAYWLWLGP